MRILFLLLSFVYVNAQSYPSTVYSSYGGTTYTYTLKATGRVCSAPASTMCQYSSNPMNCPQHPTVDQAALACSKTPSYCNAFSIDYDNSIIFTYEEVRTVQNCPKTYQTGPSVC